MGQILRSFKLNLKGLAEFSGRQSGEEFWPYALVTILGGQFIGTLAVAGPVHTAMVRMQTYILDHPEAGTLTNGPQGMSIELTGAIPIDLFEGIEKAILPWAVGIMAAEAILLAAAVTRRLRDAGRSLLWVALPPIAFALALASWTPLGTTPQVSAFVLNLVCNSAYVSSLLALAFMATRPSIRPAESSPS